ncbi:hypothetical protein BDV95DRAFT_25366 [Massariosphaeria phaeospora]|uniref:Secreted protein n=1 Tax=Massariosphaeria phaeospora TaxID=100035 RepID=A0A7C8MPQ8_9PLEO|nr:hypothetical protein BDV95DRAFT_25366 [Massariosphaeria phaeospora]
MSRWFLPRRRVLCGLLLCRLVGLERFPARTELGPSLFRFGFLRPRTISRNGTLLWQVDRRKPPCTSSFIRNISSRNHEVPCSRLAACSLRHLSIHANEQSTSTPDKTVTALLHSQARRLTTARNFRLLDYAASTAAHRKHIRPLKRKHAATLALRRTNESIRILCLGKAYLAPVRANTIPFSPLGGQSR